VVTTAQGVPGYHGDAALVAAVGKWLDAAHNVLSPAFKSLISEQLMQKFKRTP
jgi:hypothetical protein